MRDSELIPNSGAVVSEAHEIELLRTGFGDRQLGEILASLMSTARQLNAEGVFNPSLFAVSRDSTIKITSRTAPGQKQFFRHDRVIDAETRSTVPSGINDIRMKILF